MKGFTWRFTERISSRHCSFPQLYRAIQRISAHYFGFMTHNIDVLIHSHHLINMAFHCSGQLLSVKTPKYPLNTTCSPTNSRQKKVSNWLLNIMEHLAAKVPLIFSQELLETRDERRLNIWQLWRKLNDKEVMTMLLSVCWLRNLLQCVNIVSHLVTLPPSG